MKKHFLSILTVAMLLVGCQADRQVIQEAVGRQMAQFPQSTMQDIYKSFYQARFGAEHMIGDTAAVRAYMMYELAAAAADTLGPSMWYEPVGVNGACVRVYLRCVNEERLTAEQLLDAFIRSAKPSEQPEQAWAEEWKAIETIAREYNVPCSEEDRQLLMQAAQNNRAVHHSEAYRNAYHPHYRIVRRDIFENELRGFIP
jgi:hypothetical protein